MGIPGVRRGEEKIKDPVHIPVVIAKETLELLPQKNRSPFIRKLIEREVHGKELSE